MYGIHFYKDRNGVAPAMCRAMVNNGKFFARLEVLSNNQVGDNNVIQIGTPQKTGSNDSD